MTYKTHFNFGILCSSLFIMYIYKGNVDLISFILIASILSLIPDWDHHNSFLTRRISPSIVILLIGYIVYKYQIYILLASLLWFVFAKFLKHRTFTHSILGTLVFVIPFLFTPYAVPAVIGYGSHILADLTTTRGCPLFYPFSKKKITGPFTTNSKTEHLITFILIVANILIILIYILPIYLKSF